MTSTDAETMLTLSVDELGALAEMMGVARFPGMPDDPVTEASRPARQAAITAARRGLVARGLVAFGPEGTPALDAPLAELVTIPLTAELVVAAERRGSSQTFVSHYYVRPDAGVEHAVAYGSIHRLSRFPSEELLSKVVDFTQLEARNGVPSEPFTTDVASFDVLRRGMAGGDLAEAREALGANGAAFMDAIDEFVGCSRVRILRHEGAGIEGGEVVWIDAGGSIWQVEPEPIEQGAAASDQKVRVAPTSAGAIVDELLAFLVPGGS